MAGTAREPGGSAAPAPIRVVSANLRRDNARPRDAFATLARWRPDILVAVEATWPFQTALRAMFPEFRHWWAPEADGQIGGVLVLSRYPAASRPEIGPPPGAQGRGIVQVDLRIETRTLRLLAAHVRAPLCPASRRERAAALDGLGGLLSASPHATLLSGDLNLAPTMPGWRRLDPERKLRGATPWWRATWPSALHPVGLAIDHILARGNLDMRDLRVFPIPGSDHLGVATTVAFDDICGRTS